MAAIIDRTCIIGWNRPGYLPNVEPYEIEEDYAVAYMIEELEEDLYWEVNEATKGELRALIESLDASTQLPWAGSTDRVEYWIAFVEEDNANTY